MTVVIGGPYMCPHCGATHPVRPKWCGCRSARVPTSDDTEPGKGDQAELCGTLERVPSVGYRSPYRLGEVELRGATDRLEARIGREVRLWGEHVTVESHPAPPESEAARRFVAGTVPTQRYFEVRSVEVVDEANHD